MKSGIVTRNDPYLMDPSLMDVVDPNLILDYGSSLKDDVICNHFDPFLDLINYNDNQLENIILNGGLVEAENPSWPIPENEFDFDEFLKGLDLGLDRNKDKSLERPIEPKLELGMSTFFTNDSDINESEIANYEEVYTCEPSEEPRSVISHSDLTEYQSDDNSDNESVHSYSTQTTSSTLKRKISKDSDAESVAPKRKKTARRNKRVQDERVKNQNKVAAMKYRKKKREEKSVLDVEMEAEEEKNKKLKASVEELKVNIDVLKELLGKYLSPNQLNSNANQQ